jgi:propanol-preferring alcohol dehydrogenase
MIAPWICCVLPEVSKITSKLASDLPYAGRADVYIALVCVGIPEGKPQPIAGAMAGQMLQKELRIVGSAVGSRKEAIEVLELARRGVVKMHYRVEKKEKLGEIFKEMEEGKLKGRVVLDLS